MSTTEDVYRTMRNKDLLDMRFALTQDLAREKDPKTHAFCTGRIGIIDKILEERRVEPRS